MEETFEGTEAGEERKGSDIYTLCWFFTNKAGQNTKKELSYIESSEK